MFCFVNVSKMCVNVFTKRARLALALFNPLEKKNNIILFLKNRRICFVWILKKGSVSKFIFFCDCKQIVIISLKFVG
jgi:hypothetical protein